MAKERLFPDYIFESSWEVCNKVGGIYTVLSTRAKTLQDVMKDRLIFIGPDFWVDKDADSPYFIEDRKLLADWAQSLASGEQLKIRIGRWNIPGSPIAVLVDFTPFYARKNDIYGAAWNDFGVDSLHAYGDYDEASMFSYAAGKVVESFYRFYLKKSDKVVYQAHEWMTGLGALYVKKHLPEVATIFTTHATTIGRSIAGNNKPLYEYLFAYNGDQMARELNVESKHSVEKQTAHNVDCFTTVSDITDNECKELLDKSADAVLVNGFENDFVPKAVAFARKRKIARETILHVANCLTGADFDDDTLILATSGRYEFKNKGIDVYLEAMNRLKRDHRLHRQVVALAQIPGWVGFYRDDLKERVASGKHYDTPLDCPLITHNLHNMSNDNVMDMLKYLDMRNLKDDAVKIIFVPCYLDGNDGIFNLSYYDMLIGNDLSIYPSYYEPWGYTPTESAAFSVPCVTTDLAGFGLWANTFKNDGKYSELSDGVKVIHRTDYNYSEVADSIKDTVCEFASYTPEQVKHVRQKARRLAEKALWKHFIEYYYDAYDIALRKAENRK
ncbi:MAG: glycogen/starch synthase [Bacteroidaceae bacterium]|nr:glycogen/starch synthase [Bacteroidaceae bacterium]